MYQIILTIIKCQVVEVQSDFSWEEDLVHMLIMKNKIFKSKRLRNEVISDDQVMCLGSDLESVEIIEKDVYFKLVISRTKLF